jgi:hypothetical protein
MQVTIPALAKIAKTLASFNHDLRRNAESAGMAVTPGSNR